VSRADVGLVGGREAVGERARRDQVVVVHPQMVAS
jgi:hypothetical protein